MSKLLKQPLTMTYPYPILENGPEAVKSRSQKLREDIIYMKSPTLQTPLSDQTLASGANILSTPESPLKNNTQISRDNQLSLSASIPNIPSLKILEAESTTRDQGFKPFWNASSEAISKKLWLPIPIDFPDSVTTSFNGCSESSGPHWKQWKDPKPSQEKRWLETSWKFSQSFQPATTAAENTSNEDQVIVSKKVKLRLSAHQKRLFSKCFQTHRYFYNKAVAYINESYEKRKEEFAASQTCVHCTNPKTDNAYCCEKHAKKTLPWKLNISFISLRKAIMKSDAELKGTTEEWQCEVPYDTRQLAIKDAVSAYKSAISNKLRGNINNFTLGFKSRKAVSQIFWVDSNAIKVSGSSLHIFPTRLGKKGKVLSIRKRERIKLPESIESDAKIMRLYGAYYFIYTTKKNRADGLASREKEDNIIALDPGIRTFQTGYSPSGMVIKAGERHMMLLSALHKRLDEMRSLRSKAIKRTKYNMKSRCYVLEHKIKNVINDLHNQTASYLSKNFKTILLPSFSTSEMQKGSGLSSNSKRNLWTLSHYKFQQKLIGLCNFHESNVYLVQEDFTTKTCGSCGYLVDVGSSKTFLCPSCKYCMDRDVHGARNILIKTLTHHGIV
jgi:putative transposase